MLAHFKKQGYKGHLTPSTADYGADLVVEKDGRRIVIQAKRWKRTVGIEAVQQIVGAIKHYDASKGMVITNSTFTENACKLAGSNGIELWDRSKLIEVMENNNGKQLVQEIISDTIDTKNTNLCPRCNSPLVLRFEGAKRVKIIVNINTNR